MIEQFELKLIRLKSGEDIIGFCYIDDSNILHLKYPKSFYSNYIEEYEELILLDWLPASAFYSQEISFSVDNILFKTYPNVGFGYAYLKSIRDSIDTNSKLSDKINKTLKDIDEESVSVKEHTLH